MSIGLDLVELRRFSQFVYDNKASLNRLFTDMEADLGRLERRNLSRLAGTFAAKEALLKAAKVGFGSGTHPLDVQVLRSPGGAPYLEVIGRTREILDLQRVTNIDVSISHTSTTASAVVLLAQS